MRGPVCLFVLALVISTSVALRYDPAQVLHNLNQNQTAVKPIDYWGQWDGHTYTPSPSNWRFPFYTLFLDRFVNGDPSNGVFTSYLSSICEQVYVLIHIDKTMPTKPISNMILRLLSCVMAAMYEDSWTAWTTSKEWE